MKSLRELVLGNRPTTAGLAPGRFPVGVGGRTVWVTERPFNQETLEGWCGWIVRHGLADLDGDEWTRQFIQACADGHALTELNQLLFDAAPDALAQVPFGRTLVGYQAFTAVSAMLSPAPRQKPSGTVGDAAPASARRYGASTGAPSV